MKTVDINTLSNNLRLSVQNIYKKIHDKTIPFYKINGIIRFDEREVVNYLKTGSVVNDKVPYMSTSDVATELGISMQTLYAWIRNEQIPMFKLGYKVVISRDDFEDWIKTKQVLPSHRK